MQLKLTLKEKEVSLVLQNDTIDIDEQKWIDQNDLLEKFFPILEKMLEKNNIAIEDVDEFVLDTNVPDGYTTARIAQTIIQTLQFAKKN